MSDKFQRITNSELMINRILGLFISLFSVPILIKNCGVETYGIFILASSISIFLTISDFGIGNGIINSLTQSIAQKNKTQVSAILSNVLVFSIFNALLVVSVFYLFVSKLNLNDILNLNLSTNTSNQIIEVAFLGSALTLMGSVSQKLLLASLQNIRYSRFQLVIVFMTNFGLILASRNSDPLIGMLFIALLLPSAMGICFLVIQLWFDSTIRISSQLLSYPMIWQLIRNGQMFFFLQVAVILNYQIDSILISYFLSPSQVAEYSIVLKIASVPFILISAVVFPIWAQTATFLAESKLDSAHRNLVQYLKKVLQFSGLAMFLFIIFGQSFIGIWTGNKISPSLQLVLANALWIPISCFMQAVAMFLNGAMENKFLIVTTSLFTISNLSLAFCFLRFGGNVSGPMWSNSISALIFFVLPAYFLIKKFKINGKGPDFG